MTKLVNLAKVIRSKNSGPFEITFDIMFDDVAIYERVKRSGVLTSEMVCATYGVTRDDIVALMFFDPALAFKFTLRRSWAQGSVNERDTFGAAQHAPLMELNMPADR